MHRLFVRIVRYVVEVGFDNATTANGWAEPAYHTSDMCCEDTDDAAFKAPLCGGRAQRGGKEDLS